MKQLVCLAVMAILLSSCVTEKSQVATKNALEENIDIVLDSSNSWTTSRLEGIHGTGWISDHEIQFEQSVKIGTNEQHEQNIKIRLGLRISSPER